MRTVMRPQDHPRSDNASVASRRQMTFAACWHNAIFVAAMETYDLLMILVLVAATLFGFWKGMAWQIASLASLAVSYVAALRFSEQLAPVFGDHAPLNRFVAMLAIYVGT